MGVLYVAPVLIGIWSRQRWMVFIIAAACSILTIVGYFLSPEGGIPWMTVANRILSLLAIWLTAGLVYMNQRMQREKQILSLFPEENPNPVLRVAPDGRIMYANPASGPMLNSLECLVGGYLQGDCLAKIRQASESGSPIEFEYKVKANTYSVQVSPATNEAALFIYAVDITERKRAEEEASLAVRIFRHMKEAVMVTDGAGTIKYVNPAFTWITGYTAEEAIGKGSRLMKSGRHGPEFYKAMWDTIRERGEWSGEIWNRRKNGEVYPQRLTITSISSPAGLATQYAAIFFDITDLKKQEQEANYHAYHDSLTGLPNRTLFIDRLKLALSRARRNNAMVAIMFLDMDGFKRVNDGYGHATGDLLLKGVAMRLVGCLRESDTVARFGGDEFTILLEDIKDMGEVSRLAEKIICNLSETYLHEGQPLMITPSLGVAIYPASADGEYELLKKADSALYAAKRSGKRCFKLYSARMDRHGR